MQPLTWSELIDAATGGFFFVAGRERDVDRFLYSPPNIEDAFIRVVRGHRCGTDEGLLQEWAAALQFPYYFGESWVAFDDCIQVMEWTPANKFIFFVTETDKIAPDDDGLFRRFIDALVWARDRWNDASVAHIYRPQGSLPFSVVFHCDPAVEPLVITRLRSTGLEVRVRRLESDE